MECKILDELIERYDFWKVFFQQRYAADYYPSDDNCVVYFGATRGCIVPNDGDSVYKFDVETDGLNEDVCVREYQTYKLAREHGLGDYFAQPLYIGTYRKKIMYWDWRTVRDVVGYEDDDDEEYWEELIRENLEGKVEKEEIEIVVPLFQFQRADCDHALEPSDENLKRSPQYDDVFRCRLVCARFMDDYSEEEFEHLVHFLEEFHINDLHEGNVGFINGRIVFIDYGGYYTEDDRE